MGSIPTPPYLGTPGGMLGGIRTGTWGRGAKGSLLAKTIRGPGRAGMGGAEKAAAAAPTGTGVRGGPGVGPLTAGGRPGGCPLATGRRCGVGLWRKGGVVTGEPGWCRDRTWGLGGTSLDDDLWELVLCSQVSSTGGGTGVDTVLVLMSPMMPSASLSAWYMRSMSSRRCACSADSSIRLPWSADEYR